MNSLYRDDAPEKFSLIRRKLLISGSLLVAGVAGPWLGASADGDITDQNTARFMKISSYLIQHTLNAEVGKRLANAMDRQDPTLDGKIRLLLDIAKKKNARVVEDFFPDIPSGDVKNAALWIISAWYTGVISDSADAEVFAYELALMYQPTLDVMTIPSYAISGPNGWGPDAPPLAAMPTF